MRDERTGKEKKGGERIGSMVKFNVDLMSVFGR